MNQKENEEIVGEIESLEKAECCCCVPLELGMKIIAGVSIVFYLGNIA